MRNLVLSVVISTVLMLPTLAKADASLSQVFAACEASVVQSANEPLLSLGKVIDGNERQQRIRLDTEVGTLVATIFPPPFTNVLGCILWGRHPDFEAEFAKEWQDWVEWEEAEDAARSWYQDRLSVSGSFDLTDTQLPGYVVVQCAILENGIVLANQPAATGVMRQLLPNLDSSPSPNLFYQFSVMRALPGGCQAASETLSEQ